MSIIVPIEYRITGAKQAAAEAKAVNAELVRTEQAAAKAGKAVTSAEKAMQSGGSGGLSGALKGLNGSLKTGFDGFRKATDGIESMAGAVGRVTAALGIVGLAISAAVTVAELLSDAFEDDEESMAGAAEGLRALTEATDQYTQFVDKMRTTARDAVTAVLDAAGEIRDADITGLALAAQANAAGAVLGGLRRNLAEQRLAVEMELNTLRERLGLPPGTPFAALQQALDVSRASYLENQRTRLGGLAQVGEGSIPFGPELPPGGVPKSGNGSKTKGSRGARGAVDGSSRLGDAFGRGYDTAATWMVDTFGDDPVAAEVLKMRGPSEGDGLLAGDGGGGADLLAQLGLDQTDSVVDEILRIGKAMDDAFGQAQADQLASIGEAVGEDLARGFGKAAAAGILYGESFQQVTNELANSMAQQATMEAAYWGAKALAFTAMGNIPQAILAGEAAAALGAVAVAAGVTASATGGLKRPGGGGGRGASAASTQIGSQQPDPVTFSPTIIVGLDGDVLLDRMLRTNDDRAGSRAQRQFMVR